MKWLRISALAVLSLIQFQLIAMEVSKVKGEKVLIQLGDQTTSPGDEYFALDGNGLKKGIVAIKQVRDDRAIGLLLKGQAQPGWTLQKRTAKNKTRGKTTTTSRAGEPNQKAYYGIQIGYAMNKMDVVQANATSVSMSGSSITYRGIFDYELFERIWFRGGIGMQNFKVTGPSTGCNSLTSYTSACETNISYLGMDIWGRYLFATGYYRPWLGGGFSLIFPMTKSSTTLDESSITNSSIIGIGGGIDVFVTPDFYFPLQVEYGLLPKSSNVSANIISIRVGGALTF